MASVVFFNNVIWRGKAKAKAKASGSRQTSPLGLDLSESSLKVSDFYTKSIESCLALKGLVKGGGRRIGRKSRVKSCWFFIYLSPLSWSKSFDLLSQFR